MAVTIRGAGTFHLLDRRLRKWALSHIPEAQLFRRLRTNLEPGRPVIADVSVDGRRFRVTRHGYNDPYLLVGFVRTWRHPDIDTEMRFKKWPTPNGDHGYVTNISVERDWQRQGWATSMVRVLLELYPACLWTVESPNEQSGQLFLRLAERYPRQILPPNIDTQYAVDDQKRYSTPKLS